MKTITIEQHLHCQPANEWDKNAVNGYTLHLMSSPEMSEYGYTYIKPISTTVELPDDWNPAPDIVETLKEKKRELLVELQCKINAIDDQISKLTAIGCEVAA